MNEPFRLRQSGGVSQRLLESASIDKPSSAARRRAATLALTTNAFASTHSGEATVPASPPRASTTKTLATWILIGAAASGTLALLGSWLFDSKPGRDGANQPAPGMSVLAEPASVPIAPARSPEITSEPPSPPRRAASSDEVQAIEAARLAVSNGNDADALAKLNDYDHAHPNGELKPESMALRIEALSHSSRASEAHALANEFQRKYPQHPLVQQVKRSLPK